MLNPRTNFRCYNSAVLLCHALCQLRGLTNQLHGVEFSLRSLQSLLLKKFPNILWNLRI
jgi:hypothetical protein